MMSRRVLLAGSLAAGAVLASCGRSSPQPGNAPSDLAEAIDRTEAARSHSGRKVTAMLSAQQTTVDLGGVQASTLAYGTPFPAQFKEPK